MVFICAMSLKKAMHSTLDDAIGKNISSNNFLQQCWRWRWLVNFLVSLTVFSIWFFLLNYYYTQNTSEKNGILCSIFIFFIFAVMFFIPIFLCCTCICNAIANGHSAALFKEHHKSQQQLQIKYVDKGTNKTKTISWSEFLKEFKITTVSARNWTIFWIISASVLLLLCSIFMCILLRTEFVKAKTMEKKKEQEKEKKNETSTY